MWFNSISFLWFFLVVYGLYLSLDHKAQNRMLLLASWIFYGWWDYRFVALLVLSSVLDYWCGIKIHASDNPRIRKQWLMLSVLGNVSILGFFKYFNFFAESLHVLLTSVGLPFDSWTLNVILPVGISFYTFQTMSYTLDIYYKRLTPTRDFLNFALFVSFFPQLVAGPIERARNLLPRIEARRNLDGAQIKDGMFLIAWGLFKKVVIADNVSVIVNSVFVPGSQPSGVDVTLGLCAFAVQIYCDFSGYSDIARGLAKMMGMELMVNFRIPFAAVRPADFWARWHISLTSWVRDYVFIPMGANKKGTWRTVFNLIAIMTLIGLWHGAQWTFVLWGLLFGLVQAGHYLLLPWLNKIPSPSTRFGKTMSASLCRIGTVSLFAGSVVLFRAESLSHTLELMQGLASRFYATEDSLPHALWLLFLSMPMVIMQAAQHRTGDLMIFRKLPASAQLFWSLCALLMMLGIYWFTSSLSSGDEFIYFQF